MVPIVVKENQTVRGVKMSEPLMNIVKIIVILFVCLFVYNTAFGKTTTVRVFVNGESNPWPIVSLTECPHKVKVTIRNNETGKVIEGEVSTGEETTTEEEPDCE
tara:strand:- start:85 stop:396 length:312 start_codon:yes stop_codon:yes gene_type:complete